MGRKKTTVLDLAKTVRNEFGVFFNVRFVEGLESIPSFEAICKDINTLTSNDREFRGRDDFKTDSNGRIWTNVYPKSVNPFAAPAEGGAS